MSFASSQCFSSRFTSSFWAGLDAVWLNREMEVTMKKHSVFFAWGCFLLTSTVHVVGAPLVASGQSEPVENTLQETADRIEASESRTRCGKYFVLESRTFSGYEVKQVHVVLPLSSDSVALVGLYYSDIQTTLDESKDSPVLLRMKDASGKATEEVRLSKAAFAEAKGCLPPPGEN